MEKIRLSRLVTLMMHEICCFLRTVLIRKTSFTHRFPSWFPLGAIEQGQTHLHISEDIELHWRNCCHCLCILHKRIIYNVSAIIWWWWCKSIFQNAFSYLDSIVVISKNLVVATSTIFGKGASISIVRADSGGDGASNSKNLQRRSSRGEKTLVFFGISLTSVNAAIPT